MSEVHRSGAKISYTDAGREDPALLFMPGWCGSRAVFEPLVQRCSAHHRVLSVDLRGHGQSERGDKDFTYDTLAEDVLAIIEASGARQIIPVALSHAGWLALELRRRLGERIRGLVLLDWIVLDAPPPFLGALKGLQSEAWQQSRDALFGMWLEGVSSKDVIRYVREDMGSSKAEMWNRAGREIAGAYARERSPLQALSKLERPVPTLHLYTQPEDPGYLMAQQSFGKEHPWFQVAKMHGHSHFPLLEVPDEVAGHIQRFVGSLGKAST